MSYYRVDPVMWDDSSFCRLSDGARVVWFLLLTGPQRSSLPGLQRTGPGSISEILRRDVKIIESWLQELVAANMIEVDKICRVVRLPKAPKYNEAESPNQIRSWFNRWREIPDCDLKSEHVHTLKRHANLASEAHATAWNATFGKATGVEVEIQLNGSRRGRRGVADSGHDPGHDPDHEHEQESLSSHLEDMILEIVTYWQGMTYHLGNRPYSTAKRRAVVAERLQQFTPPQLKLAIRGAGFDDWFMGKTTDSPGYKGLEHLFKDVERVEKFIDLAAQHSWTLASIAAEDAKRPVAAPSGPQDAPTVLDPGLGTTDAPARLPAAATGDSGDAPAPDWQERLRQLTEVASKIGLPPDERSS